MSTRDLIKESLAHKDDKYYRGDNRYLLILTENCDAALDIVQTLLLENHKEAVVIFGSSFAKDQEYSQVTCTSQHHDCIIIKNALN